MMDGGKAAVHPEDDGGKRRVGLLVDPWAPIDRCAERFVWDDSTPAEGLKALYSAIGCECIDIARIEVGGVEYDAVVDDEGLCRDTIRIGVATDGGDPLLAGRAVIVHGDDSTGNFVSLTDADIGMLLGHLAFCDEGDGVHGLLCAERQL